MNQEFDTLLRQLAAERARYEDLRAAGSAIDAIDSRTTLHSLRARIADIQAPWDA